MVKYYCDCCGKEAKQLHKFNYLCHLSRDNRMDGYADNEGNRISGRDDSVELCIKCYNDIVSKAVNRYNELSKSFA